MGLPGSGKSSLCDSLQRSAEFREFLRSLDSRVRLARWISFDAIEGEQRAIHDRCTSQFDPVSWKATRRKVRNDLEALRSASSADGIEVTLLDDNFQYKSMRKNFKPDGIIFLNRSFDACVASNSSRPNPIPIGVIETMALSLEQPVKQENLPVITVDVLGTMDHNDVFESVVSEASFWKAVLTCSLSRVPAEVRPCAVLTGRDQALNSFETRMRKCVTAHVSSRRMNKKTISRISELKSSYMRRLKFMVDLSEFHGSQEDELDSLILKFSHDLATLDYSL